MSKTSLFKDNKFEVLSFSLVGFLTPLFFSYFFFMPFHIPKWIVLYIGAISLGGIFLYRRKIFDFPRLGKIEYWLVITCICWLFGAHLYFSPSATLRFLIFVILVLVSFSVYRRTESFHVFFWGMTAASVVTVFTLILKYFGIEFTEFFPEGRKFIPFFQNINMTAQFFGVCLLVQVYLYRSSNKIVTKFFLLLLMILIIASIYYLHSRSIYFALVVSAPFVFYKKGWSNKIVSLLVLQILVVAIFAFATFSGRESKYFHVAKERIHLALDQRLKMWDDAVDLVKEYPEGVGYDQYQFSILPFAAKNRYFDSHESQISRSPHNDFLSFTVAYGLPAAVLSFAILLILFGKLLTKETTNRSDQRIKSLTIAVFIFYSFEAIAQFPTDNAYSFLFIAVFIGVAYAQVHASINLSINLSKLTRVLSAGFLIYGLLLTVRYTTSEYLSYNFPSDHDKQTIACDIWPENWRSCLQKSDLESDAVAQRQTLITILEGNNFNYLALRDLVGNYFQSGRTDLACFGGGIYLHLFRLPGSIDSYIEENCEEGSAGGEYRLLSDMDKFMARSRLSLLN